MPKSKAEAKPAAAVVSPPPPATTTTTTASPTVYQGTKTLAFLYWFFTLAMLVAVGSAVVFRHRDPLIAQYKQVETALFPNGGGLSGFISSFKLSSFSSSSKATESTAACEDENDQCATWASTGECDKNPKYMLSKCRASCKSCTAATAQKQQRSLEEEEEEEEGAAVEEEDDDDEEEDEDDEPAYFDGDDENDEDEDAPKFVSATKGAKQAAAAAGNKECVDVDGECEGWASAGECEANPGYMLANCAKSCKQCGGQAKAKKQPAKKTSSCKDQHETCAFWAKSGECESNPGYMLNKCAKSCNSCDDDDDEDEGNANAGACQDRHNAAACRKRAAAGECTNNPGWMIVMCAASCNACHLLPRDKRCRPEVFNDPTYKYENALEKPGDLDRKFETILQLHKNTTVLSRDPYVLLLHNFVSAHERATLLGLTLPNIKRSTDQGKVDADGVQEQIVSTGRTSENAWCLHECMSDPTVANLTHRISTLLQVPEKNFESYQVLQYQIGQFYNVHHDSGDDDVLDMSGPRILTFFIYFTDVDEGGETHFDKLGLKVKPEVGSAVLWPSVLNSNPKLIDKRTTHAALPVIKGTKHAANVWVHMRDFETPNLWGCTGSFDE